jgi:hypothetical protein
VRSVHIHNRALPTECAIVNQGAANCRSPLGFRCERLWLCWRA